MILAIDVYYFDTSRAKVVGITFAQWEDAEPKDIFIAIVDNVAEYQSGEFYKRELPCILALKHKIDFTTIGIIVIDGYVYLDNNQRKGLGAYLFDTLEGAIPVVGVAKTSFHQNDKNTIEVFRGMSKKPLYITAIGIDVNTSAQHIKNMHGEFRFPTLLKLLDDETKNLLDVGK